MKSVVFLHWLLCDVIKSQNDHARVRINGPLASLPRLRTRRIALISSVSYFWQYCDPFFWDEIQVKNKVSVDVQHLLNEQWRLLELDCCIVVFLLFPISDASIRAPRTRYTTKLVRGITSRLTPDLVRVLYSFDKCFEIGADPRNSYEKQSLKIWTPCLSASRARLLRRVWSSRHRAIFEISSRTVEKL